MAPKKVKGKGKPDEMPQRQGFTEVDKTFLELQLAECNRKVARLTTAVDEYEIRNEELQQAYDKLDEDRADIIAFLKKTLNQKIEENSELKENVKGLEETREIETTQFKATVVELENNFRIMKDQLCSENKLLAGKINTLEEFRAIREDMMMKFEKQEQDFKDQEMKYKRIIYDAEKKFVIGKDKLKKEMEARLLQLAQDFQDATELRIAASTHRVIRENIAINNELDSILATQAKLSNQNEIFKDKERNSRLAMELAEEERDKTINKNVVQLKVINQLTAAFQAIKKDRALFEKRNFDFEDLQAKINKLSKDNDNLTLQVRILEKTLHGQMSENNKKTTNATRIAKECANLKKILKEAATAVKAALKLDQWATDDPSREIMDRQLLLSRLLDIITQYREMQRAESTDTLASFGKVYEAGDLGFIPKLSGTPRKSIQSRPRSLIFSRSGKSVEKIESESSTSVSESLASSVPTIPSMKLLPAVSLEAVMLKESVLSFVTSPKSSVSALTVEEEEVEMTEFEKQLAASKLEIQKSVMKDLAISQLHIKGSDEHVTYDEPTKSTIFEKVDEEEAGEEVLTGEERTGEEEEKKGDAAKTEKAEEEEVTAEQ